MTRGAPADPPFRLDAESLYRGDSFTFSTAAGDPDILGTPAGVSGFHELDPAAEDAELDHGLRVRVAALDDLIRMKRAVGRP